MSGSDTGYRIVDEPGPEGRSLGAVNPFWPLLCLVLTGILPGVLWFLYNAVALGSATRRRQVIVGGLGILGSLALAAGLHGLRASIPSEVFPYLGLLLVAWKVTIGYLLYLDQEHSLELFEYFGGQLRRGFLRLLLVIVVATLCAVIAHMQTPILGALFGEGFFLA